MPDLLFVYGTLRRGFDHPMARRLAAAARHVGEASCTGKLYRVAHYPGLVSCDEPAARVHGDLYELSDNALLTELDDYEGCGANDPPPHPYRREMIDVSRQDFTACRAWTYIYLLPTAQLPLIASGRFA